MSSKSLQNVAESSPLLPGAETGNEDVQPRQLSISRKAAIMALVFWVMVLVVGVLPGFQGIRPVLLKGGVASAECDSGDELPCKAQKHLLDGLETIALLALNLGVLPSGIVAGTVGYRRASIGAFVLWTAATCVSGLAPASGSVYAICASTQALTADVVFLAILADWLPGVTILASETLGATLATGAWDLAALTFVGLGVVSEALDPSLWLLFLLYGAFAGSSSLAGMLLIIQKEESGDAKKSWVAQLRNVAQGVVDSMREPFTWMCFMLAIPAVVYCYFFLANVTSQLEYAGGSPKQVQDLATVFSWILPFGCIVPGLAGLAMNRRFLVAGVRIVCATQALLALATGGLAIWGGIDASVPLFVVFVAFRILPFAFVNSLLPTVVSSAAAKGAVLGLLYSVSGAIGLALTPLLLVLTDAGYLPIIHGCFCGLSFLASVVLLLAAPSRLASATASPATTTGNA